MTAQIDPFTLTTAPFSMYFNDTHLSDATGFVWEQGGRTYLITNWHVVTGRDASTGENLSQNGGRPNRIRCYFNVRVAHIEKKEHVIKIRDDNDRPLWLAHPSRGRGVDVVAIPYVPDTSPIFALHPINKYIALQLTIRIAMDVSCWVIRSAPNPQGTQCGSEEVWPPNLTLLL